MTDLASQPTISETAATRPDATLWQAVVLVAVTVFVYFPVTSAGFIWNDDDLTAILKLIDQGGLSAVWLSSEAFNYWPMTWTSYWIEHQLFGTDPATGLPFPTSYHIVNVLLHAISSLLLWRVLTRLQVPAAWLVAAVFAVHPVNVESVAWITQRKNVLALFFYLVALGQFLDFEQTHHPRRYLASVLAFLLAMLSKGAVVAMPLVLLLLAWWRRGRITRTDLIRSVPFLVVAVVMSTVEIWFQQVRAIGDETIRDASLAERIMATGPIAWFYLQKTLLPLELAFVYPLWQFQPTQASLWIPLAAGIALLAVLMWATRRGLDRAPLAAVLYTLLSLAPVLGLVNIYYFRYSLVADHYQYIAMPGILTLIIGTAAHFARKRQVDPLLLQAASIGLVTVLAGLTWQQASIYQSPQRLWQDTLDKNPGCWLAHNQLANQIGSASKVDDARQHYLTALELIERQFGSGHIETARVHNNLGMLLGQASRNHPEQKLMPQAITHLETACQIDTDRSEYVENLAGVLQEQGRLAAAIGRLRNYLGRHPDETGAWLVLADCLQDAGRDVEADRARQRGQRSSRQRD